MTRDYNPQMHGKKNHTWGLQLNLTLTGKRYWVTYNNQRVDARTLGFDKAYFTTNEAASEEILRLRALDNA